MRREFGQNMTDGLTTLNTLLKSIKDDTGNKRHIPPLERWSPSVISPFNIVIDERGDWYHDGVKISRQPLVDLFASVLWAEVHGEAKRHFLKTPSDYYEITVIDTPLFINKVDKVGQNNEEWIIFGTTNGDVIVLDDKPLYFKEFTHQHGSEQRLYIDTRFNLTARINRNVFYHLVQMGELIEQDGETMLVLKSGGMEHRIIAPMT